eukprot:g17512.t1
MLLAEALRTAKAAEVEVQAQLRQEDEAFGNAQEDEASKSLRDSSPERLRSELSQMQAWADGLRAEFRSADAEMERKSHILGGRSEVTDEVLARSSISRTRPLPSRRHELKGSLTGNAPIARCAAAHSRRESGSRRGSGAAAGVRVPQAGETVVSVVSAPFAFSSYEVRFGKKTLAFVLKVFCAHVIGARKAQESEEFDEDLAWLEERVQQASEKQMVSVSLEEEQSLLSLRLREEVSEAEEQLASLSFALSKELQKHREANQGLRRMVESEQSQLEGYAMEEKLAEEFGEKERQSLAEETGKSSFSAALLNVSTGLQRLRLAGMKSLSEHGLIPCVRMAQLEELDCTACNSVSDSFLEFLLRLFAGPVGSTGDALPGIAGLPGSVRRASQQLWTRRRPWVPRPEIRNYYAQRLEDCRDVRRHGDVASDPWPSRNARTPRGRRPMWRMTLKLISLGACLALGSANTEAVGWMMPKEFEKLPGAYPAPQDAVHEWGEVHPAAPAAAEELESRSPTEVGKVHEASEDIREAIWGMINTTVSIFCAATFDNAVFRFFHFQVILSPPPRGFGLKHDTPEIKSIVGLVFAMGASAFFHVALFLVPSDSHQLLYSIRTIGGHVYAFASILCFGFLQERWSQDSYGELR